MQYSGRKTGGERERSSDPRPAVGRNNGSGATEAFDLPAAGAHAADHLTNGDLTPGAGALPSSTHNSGKEVDGAAG